MSERHARLREWAAWNDKAMETYGTDEAVRARRMANSIMDDLEPLSEADWGIIRLAQRGYLTEATA